MGRHHPLKLRIPDHLYLQLTPPPTPPPFTSSLPFASSLLSVKSAVYPPSSSAIFQETYGARAVGDKIPGFKTSAAFFTTLRANLIIDLDSPPPSCCSTPDLRPSNWHSSNSFLPLPTPLAYITDMDDLAEPQETPAVPESPPPLTTALAETEDDKVEVLHLIADSVAQQRQYATSAIIYHRITVASLIAVLGILFQFLYHGSQSDLALIGTTFIGILFAVLASTRLLTKGYIDEAEAVGTWKWLDKDRSAPTTDFTVIGTADDLLLSRFGDKPIGGLVLRGIRRHDSRSHSRNSSNNSNTGRNARRQNSNGKSAPITGTIRGWSVANRFRGKGVGTELLEEAVKLCQERGWQGPEIDAEHANAKRLLPGLFGAPFEKRERKARALLERVKEAMGVVDGGSGSTSGKRRLKQ